MQKHGSEPGRTHPTGCLLDPTEHAGAVPDGHRQRVEMLLLHEMVQGDAISLAQHAFLLPEAGKNCF
jgi:hypothetical protein